MTTKELNILEEPIENLQFRDMDQGHAIVAVYPAYDAEFEALVVYKYNSGSHQSSFYRKEGFRYSDKRICPADIIRKKKVVADWMIFKEYLDTFRTDLYTRLNAIPDPINPHEKSFKIAGTEREI